MNTHLKRASVLIDQDRPDLAEAELKLALSIDPESAFAHALLALCMAEREAFKDADREARQAIALAPDAGFAHYSLASVLNQRNMLDEAETAIREAIRLETDNPEFFGQLASIQGQREQWQEALATAELGLSHDPDNGMCINVRAMALVQLGRKDEAVSATEAALANDPEDALTHANHGWMLLRQEKHEKAMEHFREALRLDPDMDWARQGIIEALKSRHRIYRWMLRYFFWMATLSSRTRWGVIIGLYFVFKILRRVSESQPELKPIIWPILGLYLMFVMMTWVSQPLFNLMLRLNRFGRLALSSEQILASNLIGLCLLGIPVCVVAALATGVTNFLMGALLCWFLIIPISGTFQCDSGWPRRTMATYTIGLLCLGITSIVLLITMPTPQDAPVNDATNMLNAGCFVFFALGSIAAPWIANILAGVTPKR